MPVRHQTAFDAAACRKALGAFCGVGRRLLALIEHGNLRLVSDHYFISHRGYQVMGSAEVFDDENPAELPSTSEYDPTAPAWLNALKLAVVLALIVAAIYGPSLIRFIVAR